MTNKTKGGGFGTFFLTLVLMSVVFSVAFGFVGGLVSLVTTESLRWSWCLKGAEVGLALLFFIGVPAGWADLRDTIDQRDEAALLAGRIRTKWLLLKQGAPLQDAVHTMLMQLAREVAKADAAARSEANAVPDAPNVHAAKAYAAGLAYTIEATENALKQFDQGKVLAVELGFQVRTLEEYQAEAP